MILTNDLMFGYGKLQSLGKPVAQIEIGKTIFEVSGQRAARPLLFISV